MLPNFAHDCPVVSTVICARPSWPLAQAPEAVFSSPPTNVTSSMSGLLQYKARKCVPLNPTHLCTPMRSARKPAAKLRWTWRADVPLTVESVICRSAASLTHAASTISPAREIMLAHEHLDCRSNSKVEVSGNIKKSIPLLRKVRHSLPGTPLTSFNTRVLPVAAPVVESLPAGAPLPEDTLPPRSLPLAFWFPSPLWCLGIRGSISRGLSFSKSITAAATEVANRMILMNFMMQ